jgi:hypothetical protein
MRVGKYEVFWHLPMVAFRDHDTRRPRLLDDAPLGYLTTLDGHSTNRSRPSSWPELQRRPVYCHHARLQKGVRASRSPDRAECPQTHGSLELPGKADPALGGGPARDYSEGPDLEQWLKQVANWNSPTSIRIPAVSHLATDHRAAGDRALDPLPEPITYRYTASQGFEVAYWKTIAKLATGRFINKANADCVRDPSTQKLLKHKKRDLDILGDWLLAHYRKLIASHGMQGKAIAGELPFRWQTDFDFSWMDGWLVNQMGRTRERNLLVVIPGKDRSRAIIMADHYDTAYMEDLYYKEKEGEAGRVAAAGADDNHSATAALMLAAPVFLKLSRAGKLNCDVWLVHLTGEEFRLTVWAPVTWHSPWWKAP